MQSRCLITPLPLPQCSSNVILLPFFTKANFISDLIFWKENLFLSVSVIKWSWTLGKMRVNKEKWMYASCSLSFLIRFLELMLFSLYDARMLTSWPGTHCLSKTAELSANTWNTSNSCTDLWVFTGLSRSLSVHWALTEVDEDRLLFVVVESRSQ